VKERFNSFKKGEYNQKVKTNKKYQELEDYFRKINKLNEFTKYFELILLLRDIYSHPFVQEIISFAKKLGAEPFNWIGEYDPNHDWCEAFSIVHGHKSLDDLRFHSIGFVKEEKTPQVFFQG